MDNIQVYGDKYIIEDGAGVYINNVDISQVLAEFKTSDILDTLPLDEVYEYVVEAVGEDDE